MSTNAQSVVPITQALLDEIEGLPTQREVSHCGSTWSVSPFDIYAECPDCKTRFKVRAFGGVEVEDVFDAVFSWMTRPEARAAAEARITAIREDG